MISNTINIIKDSNSKFETLFKFKDEFFFIFENIQYSVQHDNLLDAFYLHIYSKIIPDSELKNGKIDWSEINIFTIDINICDQTDYEKIKSIFHECALTHIFNFYT
jgi:hypothetical protein